MIELVVSFCMVAAPHTCRDVHMSYLEQSITPYTCTHYGQSEIARWIAAHPGWKPARWSCRRAKLEAKA